MQIKYNYLVEKLNKMYILLEQKQYKKLFKRKTEIATHCKI